MSGYYSFLPYLRQGLNTHLENSDTISGSPAGGKATFDIDIILSATSVNGGTSPETATKEITLRGPGDVVGINPNAIVKVQPVNWLTNFEPNYLPYIEFFEEDFCWRYTPAKARLDGIGTEYRYRLRPWMTLVVLKEDEFELFTAPNGKPAFRVLKTPSSIFPAQEDLWACAHVHVNDNLSTGSTPILHNIPSAVNKLKGILNTNPDKAVSRIISPRRLEANISYHAFLIPTFESGRLAGLGQDPYEGASPPGMLDGAWDANTPVNTQYPVYHQWFFKTGGAGNFESLVRLLQPRILSNDVGKRDMDIQKSNNPQLEDVAPPVPTIGLQGVVQPVNATEDAWDITDDNNDYAAKIRELINKPTAIINDYDIADPVIAPPIYGRWHAAMDEVEEVPATSPTNPDWLQEVNLDPRYRVFAGIGAETIRRNQEKYMDIAWKQVGEVMEANRRLRQLQVSKQASRALYDKHLTPLNDELLINVSAPVHQRIKNTLLTLTVYKDVDSSAVPTTMLSGAFRRLTRPGGLLTEHIYAETNTLVGTTELIAEVNNGTVQPATPYLPPSGQTNYNIWSNNQLTSSFTLNLPQNSGFLVSNPGVVVGTPATGTNAAVTQVMVDAVASLHGVIQALPDYTFATNPSLALQATRNVIVERVEPYGNALNLAKSYVKCVGVEGGSVPLPDTNIVMAAPKIKIPMYEELAKLSPDWIMPGLNHIEMNSINILEVNQKYIEAYMLGLNCEMGRELLWRGYPTDQRGTCFSYFWGYNNSVTSLVAVASESRVFDLKKYRDIEDIHKWRDPGTNPSDPLTALGANNARVDMEAADSMLILTIRGELLRKYPRTLIYMQKAKWKTGVPDPQAEPREPEPNTELYPVFTGYIEPDIYLLGFTIDPEEARGGGLDDLNEPGYFVVFQERAGEIRFGADDSSRSSPLPSWDDVNWGLIKDNPEEDGFIDLSKSFDVTANPDSVIWNRNAATVAYALYRAPVKLNVHAEGLIPEPAQV